MFLDPDKGIAARRATENHVAVNELTQVWEALNPGSVLVVFQFAQRSVGWRENAIDLFGRAVGVSPRLITYFRCPRVVFLSSLKAGGAAEEIRGGVRRRCNTTDDIVGAGMGRILDTPAYTLRGGADLPGAVASPTGVLEDMSPR